jgi:transcriptional regulator with XRE-family HTH domain
MATKLSTWLANEIETRGWSIRELSRRAGISHTTVADVISQQRIPTWDFCAAIAGALDKSPEDVFRLAGLLPPLPPAVKEEREAIGLLRNLSPDLRAAALRMLRSLQPETAPPPSAPVIAESQEPYQKGDLSLAPDPSIELLGELWEQVPDWKKRDIVDQINRAVEEHEQEIEKKKSEKKVGN